MVDIWTVISTQVFEVCRVLHWNHTFSKGRYWLLKLFFSSSLSCFFLSFLSYMNLNGFSVFFQERSAGWLVILIPSPTGATRCCVWNRIMKLHDGSSKRWRNSSVKDFVGEIWRRRVDRASIKNHPNKNTCLGVFFLRMGLGEYFWQKLLKKHFPTNEFLRHLVTIKGDDYSLLDWTIAWSRPGNTHGSWTQEAQIHRRIHALALPYYLHKHSLSLSPSLSVSISMHACWHAPYNLIRPLWKHHWQHIVLHLNTLSSVEIISLLSMAYFTSCRTFLLANVAGSATTCGARCLGKDVGFRGFRGSTYGFLPGSRPGKPCQAR